MTQPFRAILWTCLSLWAISWTLIALEIFRWHHMTMGLRLNPPPVPPGLPAPKPGGFLKGVIFLSKASPIVSLILLVWMWQSHRRRNTGPT